MPHLFPLNFFPGQNGGTPLSNYFYINPLSYTISSNNNSSFTTFIYLYLSLCLKYHFNLPTLTLKATHFLITNFHFFVPLLTSLCNHFNLLIFNFLTI